MAKNIVIIAVTSYVKKTSKLAMHYIIVHQKIKIVSSNVTNMFIYL